MSLKLLYTIILVTVSSTTTLVSSPHHSASALRTPSVKCSAAGNKDDIAEKLTGLPEDGGPFSVTVDCWEKFLALKYGGFGSANLWNNFALATETVGDVTFLTAVFDRFAKYLPTLVKQGAEKSLQHAYGLLPAMRKAPKVDRETVTVVATADGFVLAEAETPAPADLTFNIPAPDASPEEWERSINGVRSKAEFAAIKEAFERYTLPVQEKRNVAGMLTIATFWVDKGVNPQMPHKPFEEIEPSTVTPAETKPAGISDDALASLGAPVKDIRLQKSNESGDEAIITRTGDEQPQLYVVKAGGELLCRGPFFSSDVEFTFCASPDRKLLMLYFGAQDTVYVYKTDAGDFRRPYREFTNIGKPVRISFSSDSRLAVFKFAERGDIAVDIEANQIVAVPPAAAATADTSAAADGIRRQIEYKQRLVAASDIRVWLESAEAIKPPDLKLFDDIQTALDRRSQRLQDGKGPLSKEIAEAKERASTAAGADALSEAARRAAEALEITLVSGVSGKEAAQKAAGAAEKLKPEAEGSSEIEIIDTEEGSSTGTSAVTLEEEEPKPPMPPAETPESVLEKAKREIASAKSEESLEAIVAKFLQHKLIKDDVARKQEINTAAEIRKEELSILVEVSLRLDDAFNSATAHLEKEYSLPQAAGEVKKSIEGCLKQAYGIFEAKAEIKKILEGLGIERDSALFKEATGLTTEKERLFKTWAKLAIKAESTSLNAKTFSELKKIEDELEGKFGPSAECLAVPKVLIENRRRILKDRLGAAIEKIRPVAGVVAQEYASLIKRLDEFKEALKSLETAAKEAKFDSLKHAADEAVDEVYVKTQTTDGRLGTQRMVYPGKWRRWLKLRPLKKPLEELAAKRNSLIGQLKLYLEAKRAILDNFKPQDLALAEDEKGKLAKLVDAVVLEMMKGRNMEQVYPNIIQKYLDKKAYRFQSIAKLIADCDKIYLRHLCKKLGIGEGKFKAITNDTFRIKGAVDLDKFMDRHGIKPVSAAVTSEAKVNKTLGSQA